MTKEDLYIECTCRCCPEQYDIYYKDKLTGYFRYRHGYMGIFLYEDNEDDIDWDNPLYEWTNEENRMAGNITTEKEQKEYDKCIDALVNHINNKNNNQN